MHIRPLIVSNKLILYEITLIKRFLSMFFNEELAKQKIKK
jgi:hypothetical protein